MRTPLSRLALGGLALALALSTACADDDDGGSTVSPSPSSTGNALAAKVPDAIKADGKILIATDSTYAPSEFLGEDGKTIEGFDVDLFKAVAAKLGLTAEFQTAPFGSIIAGVDSGKYEMGISSFTVNAERMKTADMISYFSAGTQWAAPPGSPVTPDNACGFTIAVQKDTVQVDDLKAKSKKCTDGGKNAIKIDQYQSQADATAAVVSGKDNAMLADSPVCAYAVKQTAGKLALVGEIYDSAPYGWVVKKGQTEFSSVLLEALKAAIADGSYNTALTKWGVEAGAITNPELNPAVG